MLQRMIHEPHPEFLYLYDEYSPVAQIVDCSSKHAAAMCMVDDLVKFIQFAADPANADFVQSEANVLLTQLKFTQELCSSRRMR